MIKTDQQLTFALRESVVSGAAAVTGSAVVVWQTWTLSPADLTHTVLCAVKVTLTRDALRVSIVTICTPIYDLRWIMY